MADYQDQWTREVLQARLLSAVFSQSLHRQLVLKGGFAMRALYGSERQTKDIDFATHEKLSPARLKGIMDRAIKQALSTGLLHKVKITQPKATETTSRWKINGLTERGSHIHLTIETKRHALPEGHVAAVDYHPPLEAGMPPTILVDAYDPVAMAAAKTLALTDPKRVAPRDLFDLRFLIKNEIAPAPELLSGLGREKLQMRLDTLWSKIELMTYPLAKEQLLPSLPPGVADRLTEDAWETLKIQVGMEVERWLNKGLEACSMPDDEASEPPTETPRRGPASE